MSEIRVDYIRADKDSISLEEGTKFSGTGAFGLPGGGSLKRPEVPKEGQVRYINGDVKKGLEYYNGTEWVTVGVANGSVPEGTTPIGVFGGGYDFVRIDYISISSLSNATYFGNLFSGGYWTSACSSSTRGVWGGAGGIAESKSNVIEYITIATTGNATDFGDLTQARGGPAACSSSTRGVFGGGNSGTAPTVTVSNVIDYITIPTIGNAQDFGDLISAKSYFSGCSSSTRGLFAGGYYPSFTNVIEYITIATTGNAQDFGDLTIGNQRGSVSSCSSSTRGVFGGGRNPTILNTIDYITIATTGNATDFGDLTQARGGPAACSSSTRGVFGGGYTTPTATNSNIIDYITIATTGNATDFGDLTVARHGMGALSNSHGGLLTS